MSIVPEEQAFGWDEPPTSAEAPEPTLTTFGLWFPWAAIALVLVTIGVVAVTGQW